MSVSDQELALLRLVEEDRARRCAEILAAAESQAAELRRQAHREARERVRAALVEARERAQRQVAAAAVQLQTRQRLAQQDCDTRMLDQALAALPGALIARWQQPATRQGAKVAKDISCSPLRLRSRLLLRERREELLTRAPP